MGRRRAGGFAGRFSCQGWYDGVAAGSAWAEVLRGTPRAHVQRRAAACRGAHCCLLNGGISRRTGEVFSVRKVVEWRSFRWGVESVLLDSLRPSLPVIFQVSRPRVHRGWP